MGLVGIAAIFGIAFALSTNRREIRLPLVGWGFAFQLTLAVLVLKTPFGRVARVFGEGFNRVMHYAEEGSSFVFGQLGSSQGPEGVVLAFQVLPLIIFVASLFAVLYHLGIMQLAVRLMAVIMQKTLGVSGAEALNVAANVFMGMTEAPLTIKPYLNTLTRSELMVVMTGGMATISGALMVAYVSVGGVPIEHLLTAVIMTAPAAIVMAKIIVPETETPETLGTVPSHAGERAGNVIEAAAKGASDGLMLSLNVGAMLVAFVGLIALLNGLIGAAKDFSGLAWMPPDVQSILALVFAPIAWLMGVQWADAGAVGNLLGTRLVLNEFIAYVELSKIKETLDPQSFLIAGYALCGFANLGSIGILVGSVGSLMPERKSELAQLGIRAMLAATMANFLTACIAGLLA